ncbi:hypothetical protein [Peribacillus deserti]|uniref:hypothetical protein n=1 Tax=Peribacillus deserti TaxID=673318 RepID=UPI0015E098E9|nr:hypothetical protein [Peribacillus deserti]
MAGYPQAFFSGQIKYYFNNISITGTGKGRSPEELSRIFVLYNKSERDGARHLRIFKNCGKN